MKRSNNLRVLKDQCHHLFNNNNNDDDNDNDDDDDNDNDDDDITFL